MAVQTGLRVSELVGLDCGDVSLGTGASVRCVGKGRRHRAVPLTAPTEAVLRVWMVEPQGRRDEPLFPTPTGRRLSSDAIERLLRKHAGTAAARCPSLDRARAHPHVLRHSCAMSLLQAGVDTAVIALWLGHARVLVGHTPALRPDPAEPDGPPRPIALVGHLRRRGFGDDELVDAGLASRYPDGTVRDFFSHRLVLPVRDGEDRVVGFAGPRRGRTFLEAVGRRPRGGLAPALRLTAERQSESRGAIAGSGSAPPVLCPDGDPAGRRVAMSWVSPQSAIYDKARLLYRATRRDRPAPLVVVEGALDALAIDSLAAASGSDLRAVSPSGTALTATHQAVVAAGSAGPMSPATVRPSHPSGPKPVCASPRPACSAKRRRPSSLSRQAPALARRGRSRCSGRPSRARERSLRARAAAYSQHAKHDTRQTTAAGRRAFLDRFETQVDPDRVLPEAERRRRAEAARRSPFLGLALQSARARRSAG